MGVSAEDQRTRAVSPQRVLLPLALLRPKGRSCPQTVSLDCICLHQVSGCSCLLPPYIPLSAQPYHSCLHLLSAGIKGRGSQVLGSPLCELCFSFRQIFNLVQPRFALDSQRPLYLCLLSPGIKGVCHHSLASRVLAFQSDLQGSLIY